MHKFQPQGWRTVIPRIVTPDPKGLVEFLKRVFDAVGEFRTERPTELKIGDSIIMVSGNEARDAMPAFLHVYVQDVDAAYRRAIAADAISLEEPADQPYGDRRAMVKDSWGNVWQIATHKGQFVP